MLLLVRFPVEVYVGNLFCGAVVGDGGGEFGGDVACVRAIVVNGELACALAVALESFIHSSSDNALLKLFVRLVVLVLVVVAGFVGSGFGARLNRLDGGVVGVGLVTALFSLLRFVSFGRPSTQARQT